MRKVREPWQHFSPMSPDDGREDFRLRRKSVSFVGDRHKYESYAFDKFSEMFSVWRSEVR